MDRRTPARRRLVSGLPSTWYPAPPDDEAAATVAAAFAADHGRPPQGVWAAPGRVNLIGEHVDYNGGSCLPFALPQRTYAAVATGPGDELCLRSVQADGWQGHLIDVGPGAVPGWAGYAAGVPWALRQEGLDIPGLAAVIDGHVPWGSGLSSSAALECAIALALDDLLGLGLAADDAGRARLAAACVRAENEIAGAPTGGMDQAAAMRARPGGALLLDCRDFSVEHLPLDLPASGLELLVIDTRARHALVDGRYGSRREACRDAARLLGVRRLAEVRVEDLGDALAELRRAVPDAGRADEMGRRVRHVVTEVDRVQRSAQLLRAGRPRELAPLLDASHASLRDDYQVSCDELDAAVTAARAAGALGARMTGGGFGGSAIALVETGGAEPVAGEVRAAFDRLRYRAPAFLHAVPSGPAERVG
jgi:galactokinase